MESPGAKLKKARLDKGLTLQEVSKQTKIHLNILNSIEEDNLDSVSPIYRKGFIKIYSKLLGVTVSEAVSETDSRQQTNIPGPLKPSGRAKEPIIPPDTLRLVKKVALFLVLVLFIVLFLSLIRKLFSHRTPKRKPPVTSVINEAKKTSAGQNKPVQNREPVKPESGKGNKAVVSSETALGQGKNSGDAGSVKKKASSSLRVSMRTREDCWVYLKIDGKVATQRVLERGSFETWQAREKIELSLGNAGVVDLEINGKAFSNLGRKGQALKNIVITKEGLDIPK